MRVAARQAAAPPALGLSKLQEGVTATRAQRGRGAEGQAQLCVTQRVRAPPRQHAQRAGGRERAEAHAALPRGMQQQHHHAGGAASKAAGCSERRRLPCARRRQRPPGRTMAARASVIARLACGAAMRTHQTHVPCPTLRAQPLRRHGALAGHRDGGGAVAHGRARGRAGGVARAGARPGRGGGGGGGGEGRGGAAAGAPLARAGGAACAAGDARPRAARHFQGGGARPSLRSGRGESRRGGRWGLLRWGGDARALWRCLRDGRGGIALEMLRRRVRSRTGSPRAAPGVRVGWACTRDGRRGVYGRRGIAPGALRRGRRRACAHQSWSSCQRRSDGASTGWALGETRGVMPPSLRH